MELLLMLGIGLFMVGSSASVALWLWGGRGTTAAASSSQADKERAKLRARTAKEEARRMKEIKIVAKKLRGPITQSLVRQGFCWVYERKGARANAARPRLGPIMVSQDAVYFRVSRMPFRTQLTDLLEDRVAIELALDIGRECQFIHDIELGMWLQVSLRSGLAAIPKFFPWHDERTAQNAVELLHTSKPYEIAIGLGENRRFIYEDFREFPHLLVAGATDGGKSVFLNQMICTLLKRNPPTRLKLMLIDLKGGLEFTGYEAVPHLWQPVIDQREDVAQALDRIRAEKDRRFAMMKRAGVRNIRAWNKIQTNKLPYILVVFDEIMNLMLDTKLKRAVTDLLTDLATQARAAGIHMILCTQYPNRDTVATPIKANVPTAICFATNDTGSMVVLGNGRAKKLPVKSGRAIYQRGAVEFEVQCPFISDYQITEVIAGLTGDQAAPSDEITADDLFLASLLNYNGWFKIDAMFEGFGQHGASRQMIIDTGQTFEYNVDEGGPVLQVEGHRMILAKVKTRGGRARRLLPVNGQLPANLAEIDDLAANVEEDYWQQFGEIDSGDDVELAELDLEDEDEAAAGDWEDELEELDPLPQYPVF